MNDKSIEIPSELEAEADAFSEEEIASLTVTDEAEQVEESAPEPAQDDSQEAEKPEERQDMVPHQALHAERLKTKELRAEIEEIKGFQRQIAENWQRHKAQQEQQQREAQEEARKASMPNKDEDPLGYSDWRIDQLEQQNAQLNQRLQQFDQANQQGAQFQQEWASYVQEVEAGKKYIEDFDAAVGHLEQVAAQQLQSQGVPAQYLRAELQNMGLNLFNTARASGVPLAKLLYFTAQQHGYTPQQASGSSEGADNKAKLEKLSEAQNTNMTLSKSGGAGSGEITLKDLAAMSGEELEAFANNDPEAFARLAG